MVILEIWEYLPITKGLNFSSQLCDIKILGNSSKKVNKNSQIYARNAKNPKLPPMFFCFKNNEKMLEEKNQ